MDIHKLSSINALNFYNEEFFNIEQLYKNLDSLSDDEKCYHHLYLFITRIFWKMMNDLDVDNEGYDVENWELPDYIKLFKDIDKIDLNSKSYQLYFKEMFGFLLNFTIHNTNTK
jgi:hypothetical protein